MSVKKGLGKGFDSLVPTGASVDIVTTPKNEKVHHLAVDIVKPRVGQPRQNFDEQLLEQLAQSIREQGILQPIVVAEHEHNNYSIVAGERRWRAARLAGLEVVPAIIKQVNDLEHLELSLLENVQRADLNAIETAKTIERLHKEYQQSYEDIAIRLGKAYTTVVNAVRLLQLPQEIQKALMRGEITEGHGRALLAVAKNPDAQMKLFKQITSKKLSVRQAEEAAVAIKQKRYQGAKASPVTPSGMSKKLTKTIGLPVKVSKSTNKGSITISYKNKKEYEQLIKRLQK